MPENIVRNSIALNKNNQPDDKTKINDSFFERLFVATKNKIKS